MLLPLDHLLTLDLVNKHVLISLLNPLGLALSLRYIEVIEQNFSTKTDVFHKLKDENITGEGLNKLTNYCNNFVAGMAAYRLNVPKIVSN